MKTSRIQGLLLPFLATIIFMVLLSFTASAQVYAASSADVAITNLFGDANISQNDVQTDLKEQGYRSVKLSWDTSGSGTATSYQILTCGTKKGTYKRLLTVSEKSAKVLLLKGKLTYIKVQPYSNDTPGTASEWIAVDPGKSNATKVTFTQSAEELAAGTKFKFQATADGNVDNTVRWRSSNRAVATFNTSGRATLKATGTFTATAIAHDGARKSVTVKVIEKYPQSLTATCDTAYTLLEGKTVQLGVEASEAMIVNVTWSSSDKTVAKVTQKGKVTAKGTGKATITASAEGGASVKFKITVNPNTEEMVLWAESIAQNDKYGYSMGTTRGKEGSGSKKLNRYCGICHKWDSRDYDCASFVCAALAHGYKDPAFIEYCGNYGIGGCRDLYNKLLKAGWEDKGNLKGGKLKRGDILINPGAHVEIYYGEGMTVGAHDNYDGKKGDGSGREIRVGDIYGHFWNHVLRKPSN